VDPKVVGLGLRNGFRADSDEIVGDIGKSYPPPPALADPIIDSRAS